MASEKNKLEFEIYYQTDNNEIKIGVSSGFSFRDACCKYSETDINFASKFNSDKLTFGKHELLGKLL
ncbi:MAG: hypothetical protein K0R54_704 [Clostridiaceae bacterium]|nr:hypothetical protein [Clostridiaceae bacterium]